MTERVYLFKGFERFWHWSQALLVMTLLFTGFEIHGTYKALGFARAVDIHTLGAWSLVGLWVFAVFWHLTTGEWRHYIPTTGKLLAMARYYSSGIFRHEPHPFRPTAGNKHNPLGRLGLPIEAARAILFLASPLASYTTGSHIDISGGLSRHA